MLKVPHSLFADMDGLAIFVTIARQGTLTAASTLLDMPKATVSRRLAGLERTLGVRLMTRTTRRWALTDPGRELYARVEPMVAALSEAAETMRAHAAEPAGLVRITAPGGFGQTSLAPSLTHFLKQYPKIRVELLLREDLADLVAEGIDIAIRTGELVDSALISRRLATNPFCLVASRGYLKANGIPKALADLANHEAIVRSSADSRVHLEGPQGQVEIAMRWRLAVEGMVAQLQAALAGVGIAVMPERFIADDVEAGRLVVLKPGGMTPAARPMTMLYPKGQVQSAAVRKLADFLIEEFGKESSLKHR